MDFQEMRDQVADESFQNHTENSQIKHNYMLLAKETKSSGVKTIGMRST